MTVSEALRLARFFGALTIKEHVRPSLHVRPLVAELFLTDNCNLKCVSCGCWRSETTEELSTSEWQDVIRQLRAAGIQKMNFTGGEALIRRDSVDLLSYASEVGIRRLHLNTNGIMLTDRKREAVLSAGVRSFNISIDGRGALHDEIRGRKGAFDRTLRHLEGLVEETQGTAKIRMNFTLMRDNLHGLLDVIALAQEKHVQLYLNLASDQTFLFRNEEVSEQTEVDPDELNEVLARVEEAMRKDPRFLPRYSDMRYIPGHFSDIVQPDLPCAESQLKLMVHSRGEVGGCWGHDPRANVREMPIESIIDSPAYREEHARFFVKDCVGCGSNYSLNLRWRPRTYIADALATPTAPPGGAVMRPSAPLFDALASEYAEHFALPHRAAYDDLAWEHVEAILPRPPGLVVDAGCGVGRWAGRLIDAGHRVIGIEPAPEMARVVRERGLGDRFDLIEGRMEDVDLEEQADLVLAMGSLQYSRDPEASVARLADWARPGGTVLVLVDSLIALAVELLRTGRRAEALERLRTHEGVWRTESQSAELHLLHRERLEAAFAAADLREVRSYGLLVGVSVEGREQLGLGLEEDPEGRLAAERDLMAFPEIADLGKQLMVEGRVRS